MSSIPKNKILRTNPHFHDKKGGVSKSVKFLLQHFSDEQENHLLTTNVFYLDKTIHAFKGDRVHVYLDRVLAGIKEYLITPISIFHLFKKRFDLIHVHSFRNFQSDIALLYGILNRKPVILSPHGSIIEEKGSVLGQIFRKLYDFFLKGLYITFVDAWVVTSSGEGENLKKFLGGRGSGRIIKIPLGIDKNIYADKQAVNNFLGKWDLKNKFVITFVGRVHARKGIHHVLQALSQIKHKHPELIFLVIGQDDGYLNTLKLMAKKLNLESNIRIVGFLKKNPSELFAAYYCSNVVVVPSQFENFGHVFVEAGILKKPIITSAGFTDVFVENDVFHYNHGNVKELGMILDSIMSNPKIANEKAEGFYQKIMKMCTWDESAKKNERLYKIIKIRRRII